MSRPVVLSMVRGPLALLLVGVVALLVVSHWYSDGESSLATALEVERSDLGSEELNRHSLEAVASASQRRASGSEAELALSRGMGADTSEVHDAPATNRFVALSGSVEVTEFDGSITHEMDGALRFRLELEGLVDPRGARDPSSEASLTAEVVDGRWGLKLRQTPEGRVQFDDQDDVWLRDLKTRRFALFSTQLRDRNGTAALPPTNATGAPLRHSFAFGESEVVLNVNRVGAGRLDVQDRSSGQSLPDVSVIRARSASDYPTSRRRPVLTNVNGSGLEVPTRMDAAGLPIASSKVFIRGPAHAWRSVQVDHQSHARTVVGLDPGGDIAVDLDGFKELRLWIHLYRVGSSRPFTRLRARPSETAELDGIPVGTYEVHATLNPRQSARIEASGIVDVRRGSRSSLTLKRGSLIRPRPGSIRCRVYLPATWQLRLPRIALTLRDPETGVLHDVENPSSTWTQLEGRPDWFDLRIKNVPSGPATVSLLGVGQGASVEVHPETEAKADIVCPAPTRMRVSVITENGDPEPDSVSVLWAQLTKDGETVLWSRRTRIVPGELTVMTPPGPIRIMVTDSSQSVGFARVNAEENRTIEVTLRATNNYWRDVEEQFGPSRTRLDVGDLGR